jgi:hypothetical protein
VTEMLSQPEHSHAAGTVATTFFFLLSSSTPQMLYHIEVYLPVRHGQVRMDQYLPPYAQTADEMDQHIASAVAQIHAQFLRITDTSIKLLILS